MTPATSSRWRSIALAAVLGTAVVGALVLYLARPHLLYERQPLISACQAALEFLTASTTATRTIASEGPLHTQDRAIVRLEYEFRNVFAGQRPGQMVCEFSLEPAVQAPALLAIDIEGESVQADLLAEINAVIRDQRTAGQ